MQSYVMMIHSHAFPSITRNIAYFMRSKTKIYRCLCIMYTYVAVVFILFIENQSGFCFTSALQTSVQFFIISNFHSTIIFICTVWRQDVPNQKLSLFWNSCIAVVGNDVVFIHHQHIACSEIVFLMEWKVW